jgi:hypothetical protein
MQFKLIPAFLIFIGSYFPLAIILAVQDIPTEWWNRPLCLTTNFQQCSFNPFNHWLPTIFFITVTLASTLLVHMTLHKISFPVNARVETAKPIPNDIINYVSPYVVSFMGISYAEPGKFLGFSIFLLWMFVITYKSGQIIMNPLLLIFGWKLYEASISINNASREVRVLKQGDLVPGQQHAQKIQDFYILKDCDNASQI